LLDLGSQRSHSGGVAGSDSSVERVFQLREQGRRLLDDRNESGESSLQIRECGHDEPLVVDHLVKQ
jgi:hypothetical protein